MVTMAATVNKLSPHNAKPSLQRRASLASIFSIFMAMAYVMPSDGDAEAFARSFMEGLSTDEFPHTIAHVQQHLDGDTASSFELVLDLLLDGLARRR